MLSFSKMLRTKGRINMAIKPLTLYQVITSFLLFKLPQIVVPVPYVEFNCLTDFH